MNQLFNLFWGRYPSDEDPWAWKFLSGTPGGLGAGPRSPCPFPPTAAPTTRSFSVEHFRRTVFVEHYRRLPMLGQFRTDQARSGRTWNSNFDVRFVRCFGLVRRFGLFRCFGRFRRYRRCRSATTCERPTLLSRRFDASSLSSRRSSVGRQSRNVVRHYGPSFRRRSTSDVRR